MCRLCLTVMLISSLAASAAAQSVNIDFSATFGTPDPDYAGAGQPGVWNQLHGDARVPQPLVGLEGQRIGATLTFMPGSVTFGQNHPGTSGGDEALLDDAIGGLADVVGRVTLDGLAPGIYTIQTFAWVVWNPDNLVWVWLNDESQPQVIGGPWPGAPQQGVTHSSHEIFIAGGHAEVNVVAGVWGHDWWLNGMQIVLQSSPGDLNCDGDINAFDVEPFLLALFDPDEYGAQYPDCEINLADINGDGEVNTFDIEPFVDLLFGP